MSTGLGVSSIPSDRPAVGRLRFQVRAAIFAAAVELNEEGKVVRRPCANGRARRSEQALSGPGLVNLYRALSEIDGRTPRPYRLHSASHRNGH